MIHRLLLSFCAAACALSTLAVENTVTLQNWGTAWTETDGSNRTLRITMDTDEFGNENWISITSNSASSKVTDAYLSIYKNSTLTIASPTNILLKKITFTFTSKDYSFKATITPGSMPTTAYVSKAWTYADGTSEITFSGITIAQTYNSATRISSMEVTYDNVATSSVEDVIVEGDNTEVYYSLDGRIVTDFATAENGFYVRVANGRSSVILKR
ncbi:MAG: hypothetical protein ACI31C_00060 [Muribaculaceae bacterium]